ncbi:MAG TPA: DUF1993 domain-containing protein [Candidatus Binataceae bacterium]|nr:DUF1993 domain-containing protein [Candidatus Binataceae bacterium]
MSISMNAIAIETFVPMLQSLSQILDKGAQLARAKNLDDSTLPNSRLAPDMYPLIKQVQLACDHARDATARLTELTGPTFDDSEQTIDQLKARIAKTVQFLQSAPPAAFQGTEDRAIKIPIPDNMAIEMTGLEFLRDWSMPHFYFHVVTAYDILRHHGVDIGKRDYLSYVGKYIRPLA